jgi:hypothetical protein
MFLEGQFDVYEKAAWVPLLEESGIMVCSDLDKHLTLDEGRLKKYRDELITKQEYTLLTGREHAGQKQFRENVRRIGAIGCAITARTGGMVLSERGLRAAQAKGFDEPEPHCGKNADGKHVFVDMQTLPFYQHCLDWWDIICSFGSGIIVRHEDGHAPDQVYDQLLKFDWLKPVKHRNGALARARNSGSDGGYRSLLQYQDVPEWRVAALTFLRDLYPDIGRHMSRIESTLNYLRGDADNAPLRARIQLEFKGKEGLERMLWLMERIKEERYKSNPLACRLRCVDESKVNWVDPEHSEYVLYIVPDKARKENLLNWILRGAAHAADRPTSSIRLLYGGDAFTDFRAGLYGGGDAQTSFLLSPGSPLAPAILERKKTYGSDSLAFLYKSESYPQDRLQPIPGRPGEYLFRVSTRGRYCNHLVIGDIVYSDLTPPEAMAQFVEDYAHRAPVC